MPLSRLSVCPPLACPSHAVALCRSRGLASGDLGRGIGICAMGRRLEAPIPDSKEFPSGDKESVRASAR